MSGWLPALAARAADDSRRKRACILLWMSGGPSQLDTFDPKPDHENGGPIKAIDTSVTGIQISEHLPQLAKRMKDVAVIRSMQTKEGDHARATYLTRTGYRPAGPIHYPSMGSLFSKELAGDQSQLPNYISVGPYRFLSPAAFGPGFLGPQHAPMVVGDAGAARQQAQAADYGAALRVRNLEPASGVDLAKADARLKLLSGIDAGFRRERPDLPVSSHKTAYENAVRMMRSKAVGAFGLEQEPDELRDKYGKNLFGQGCLLARRLIQRGVPFVEVGLNGVQNQQVFGWDTHQNNFDGVKSLCGVLDPAWATLMEDLEVNGLLESTTIIWMGEFGRTPAINQNGGRDHFPVAWSTALCGGGINGGQIVGKTSEDGMTVADRPVSVADLLATVCVALGLDPAKQNMSNVGRPTELVDRNAKPISGILA